MVLAIIFLICDLRLTLKILEEGKYGVECTFLVLFLFLLDLYV